MFPMQSFLQILTGVSFIPALCGKLKLWLNLYFQAQLPLLMLEHIYKLKKKNSLTSWKAY